MAKNTKKITLSPSLADDAGTYASALDEIGGKTLAEEILEDDEDSGPRRALAKLKGEKANEARWIMGWFRGVADAKGCDPIAVLRAGRMAVSFEDDENEAS